MPKRALYHCPNRNVLCQLAGLVVLATTVVLAVEKGEVRQINSSKSGLTSPRSTTNPITSPIRSADLHSRDAGRNIQQCRTISEILCETAVFGSFCELLNDFGLGDLLDDRDSQWTVFAPTNSALNNLDMDSSVLLTSTNDTNATYNNNNNEDEDEDPLIDLLRYHLIQDRAVNGTEIACGKTFVMFNGGSITVVCGDDISEGSKYLVGDGNNENVPQVVVTDSVACNGIIHVINGVLLDGNGDGNVSPTAPSLKAEVDPELFEDCQSIQEVVCGMDDLSLFCSFLDDERILKSDWMVHDFWTLFAPTDEAFDIIKDTLDGKDDDTILDIMKFHTVHGEEWFSDDLVCGTDLIMGNGQTSLTTCSTFSGYMYQQGPGNVSPRIPRIIDADKLACNGVVHVVNHVVLPDFAPREIPTYN